VIDAYLMPVKDETGKVVFIEAEGPDITEKKAYEREIRRQREEDAVLVRSGDGGIKGEPPPAAVANSAWR
jgi:hypothetical protein